MTHVLKANGYVCPSEVDAIPCKGGDKKHDCEPYCKFAYGKTYVIAECIEKNKGDEPICTYFYNINKPC